MSIEKHISLGEFSGFSLKRFLLLVRTELVKLFSFWLIQGGYVALLGIALIASYLVYHIEQAVKLASGSGYAFAIGLLLRGVDIGAPILFLMMCVIFSIEMNYGTLKNILTRSVTRIEMMLAKYFTAWIMIILAIGIFLAVGLGMGAHYYGLGDLTEDGYLLFPRSVIFKELAIALLFLMVPLVALSSLAMFISSFSSTMGGAMIFGLIAYLFFDLLGIIPNNLGIKIGEHFLPYSAFGFPTQRFVPLYILDDLPAGIPIQSWWVWDIQKMVIICGIYFIIFFSLSLVVVKKRDFTL